MIQKVGVPVSVTLTFNCRTRQVLPGEVVWESKTYLITKIGLHHTFRQGQTLYHVFSVTSGNLFFRLVLNTKTLFWTLEEIADGLAD